MKGAGAGANTGAGFFLAGGRAGGGASLVVGLQVGQALRCSGLVFGVSSSSPPCSGAPNLHMRRKH